MNNWYVGIDPGKSGGLATIFENGDVEVEPLPVTDDNEIDVERLAATLRGLFIQIRDLRPAEPGKIYCVLEDVHSIFGMSAKSNFQFGRVLGILEGVLGATGTDFIKITPKVWQKEIWANTPPISTLTGKNLKNGTPQVKIDTKGTSLMVAKALFPDVNLLATKRSKVPHDGIVDALLIAEYCRRKFKK